MPISFNCQCGKSITAPDRDAGRVRRCPGCDALSVVPTGPPDQPVFERALLAKVDSARTRLGWLIILAIVPYVAGAIYAVVLVVKSLPPP